ncbi:ribonuclease P [archaeon]|nr:ribonuclease P [archaeon]
MNRKKIAEKSIIQKIALERIYRLFELAGKAFKENEKNYARQLVGLALRIGKRNKVPMPSGLKESYCKSCKAFLAAGKNARKRIKKGCRVLTCMECGKTRKIK